MQRFVFGLRMPKRYGKEAETPQVTEGQENNEQPAPQKTFTQEEVDAIVKKRVAEEKDKAEKAAQKAKEEAEAEALAKNAEFEELANKRAEKVKELEAEKGQLAAQVEELTKRLEEYEKVIKAQLEAQRKGLPNEYIELLDALEPLDQLAWLAKHREKLTKQQEYVPGSPGKDGRGMTAEQAEIARKRAAVFYRSF